MNAEKKKIKQLINEIPANRKPLGDRILKELFFMIDTLDELKKDVNKNGSIIRFHNGKQEMNIQNPALKAYNETMTKFNRLLKDFNELLPNTLDLNNDSKLMEFVESA